MAEAVWTGSLRLSLVSCPIYLTAAVSNANSIKLQRLSAKTGNPVTEQFVDAKTGDIVPGDALVKGYEFEKSRYVTVSADELDKLGRGTGDIIDIDQFVLRQHVDPLHIAEIYFVHAEGQLASDTLHALRVAMQKSGRVALGHVRIGDGERPTLIEPYRAGLMMSTLRTQDELLAPDFTSRADSDIPTDMVEIAETIISRRVGDFDAKKLRDRYQDDLKKLVEEKAKKAPAAPSPATPPRPAAAPPPARPVLSVVTPPAAPAPPTSAASTTAASATPAASLAPAAPPSATGASTVPAASSAPAAPPSATGASTAPAASSALAAPSSATETSAATVASREPGASTSSSAAASPPAAAAPAAAASASSAAAVASPPKPASPPESTEPNDVGTEILLHIMGLGDRRYVEPGWAGNPGSRRQIEALSIRPRDGLAASAVEFRVFAQEGRATAWVSNGNYAGTRGRNLPLTGFAVRPVGELGERLDIAYEGSFFEGGVVGPKKNGELCVSPVADDPLEAIRVTILDQETAPENDPE